MLCAHTSYMPLPPCTLLHTHRVLLEYWGWRTLQMGGRSYRGLRLCSAAPLPLPPIGSSVGDEEAAVLLGYDLEGALEGDSEFR